MEEEEINATTKAEQFATFRQTITPHDQSDVAEILGTLIKMYRMSKVTGSLTVHFNQGGIRNLTTDQLAKIVPGSQEDTMLEDLFARQQNKLLDRQTI
jgi:hypothetical protein